MLTKHQARIITKIQPDLLLLRTLFLGTITLLLATVTPAIAATIWDGPVITFSEVTTDPTLAMNQDRMTDDVWITRDAGQGIFNARLESGFTHSLSPSNTAWADGILTDYASLTYTDWNTWAKVIHGGPPFTVGVNAVVHLISDDIYLGLKFTSWGGSGTWLFSYERTTPPAPPPIPLTIAPMSN